MCELMRQRERERLTLQAMAVTILQLPDQRTAAPTGRNSACPQGPSHTLLSHFTLSTHTASRSFPDQQELGTNPTPYASDDLMLIITSFPSVLLKSQTNHLIGEPLGAHMRRKSRIHYPQWPTLPTPTAEDLAFCGKRPQVVC